MNFKRVLTGEIISICSTHFDLCKFQFYLPGIFSIRVNLLHNHLLDETEKMSSMALDLKRKLDNIEFELARPPRPMLKKRILARYEKLPKMGRSKEAEVVPISVNNNKSPLVKNDRLPKNREQSTYVSTNSKSELSQKSSKKSKEKYSRLDGIDRQHKIKKVSHTLILIWRTFRKKSVFRYLQQFLLLQNIGIVLTNFF